MDRSHEGLLSWKLDGLTIVLSYREGELYKAVTRATELPVKSLQIMHECPESAPQDFL